MMIQTIYLFEAPLDRVKQPRATHQGCGLSLVVSLTPIQRVCRQEQYALAAFLSSPVLLRVRRDRRGSRYDVGSWEGNRRCHF